MKHLLSSAAVIGALAITPALADAELYMLDPSHSQVIFS